LTLKINSLPGFQAAVDMIRTLNLPKLPADFKFLLCYYFSQVASDSKGNYNLQNPCFQIKHVSNYNRMGKKKNLVV
jgi:hypothetical protein